MKKTFITLFDNLQEQVDTLAGEIAEIKKEKAFEDYDKKLDQILEEGRIDKYFEERIDQTEKDTEIILNCLRYCRHRFKHPESGIHKADVKLKDIKRLIKELE